MTGRPRAPNLSPRERSAAQPPGEGGRQWRPFTITIAALLIAGLSGCAAGRAPAPEAAPPAPTLRVLSYNIHHGEGTDGRFDLERLARVIASERPDLVALQEVDRATTRASGVDQAVELGRLTGMAVVYGKAMDYAGGQYGEAILSRLPIVDCRNHALPHGARREPRAALAVTVEHEDLGAVTFLATHLAHDSEEDRLAQARRINELSPPDETVRRVLAGDLNAEPGSPPMEEFFRAWADAAAASRRPTYPSDQPRIVIDYVLYQPAEAWSVLEVRVLGETIASDHRPLLAVLSGTAGN